MAESVFTSAGGGGGVIRNLNPSQKFHVALNMRFLWLHIKPKRLPREFSSIIAAVLHHPPRADDTSMLNHLFH